MGPAPNALDQDHALMTVRRRFLHPIWLLVSLPGYIGLRLLPNLGFGIYGMCAGVALLIAACVVIPFSLRVRSMRNRRLADRIAWVGLLAMGFFSSLFVATLLRDLFLLAAHSVLSGPQAAALSVPSARYAVTLTLIATFVGLIVARRPRLVEVNIPVLEPP